MYALMLSFRISLFTQSASYTVLPFLKIATFRLYIVLKFTNITDAEEATRAFPCKRAYFIFIVFNQNCFFEVYFFRKDCADYIKQQYTSTCISKYNQILR